MKVKNKKHMYLLINLIPILITFYLIKFKNIFAKENWYIIVMYYSLLVFVNLMWYMQPSITYENRMKIRRTYYCISTFVLLFLLGTVDNNIINIIGQNKLGISNNLVFTLDTFIAIILIDIFIISCKGLDEITFGATKVKFHTIEKSIETQINITETLIDKIKSEYKAVQNIDLYISDVENDLRMAADNTSHDVDILKHLENYLEKYFCTQEKDKIYIEILALEEVQSCLNLSNSIKKYYSRYESIVIETRLFDENNKHYLCIPYQCTVESIIILKSDSNLILAEECIIYNLTKIFENKLLSIIDDINCTQEQ